MKTERRHELQTNQLADWIGHQVEHMRPHVNVILGVAVLGAAVIIGYFVYTRDRQSALQDAWGDYYLAMGSRDRDALKEVAKLHPNTIVELCAKQAQGDMDLNEGIKSLYIDRTDAYRLLDDAKKSYTQVVNNGASYPELAQHALFGLAQVNEATSNLDKAKEYYQKVSERFPESPMAVEAKSRLQELNDPQTEKWYSWFSRQKPKPPLTQPGMPPLPGLPDDLSKLPDFPSIPSTPTKSTPGAGTSESATPEAAAPATTPAEKGDPAKPGEPDKNAESKKADEPKSDDSKSSTTTPGDKPAEPPKSDDKKAEDKPAATETKKAEETKSEPSKVEEKKTGDSSAAPSAAPGP